MILKTKRTENISSKLILITGTISISLLLTPIFFRALGVRVGNAILNFFGETVFLSFGFGFPGVLSGFLYLLGCRFLKKEKFVENIIGGVSVGIITIGIWLIVIMVAGERW